MNVNLVQEIVQRYLSHMFRVPVILKKIRNSVKLLHNSDKKKKLVLRMWHGTPYVVLEVTSTSSSCHHAHRDAI